MDLVNYRQLHFRDHRMYVLQVGPRAVHHRGRFDEAAIDPDARDGAAFAFNACVEIKFRIPHAIDAM